MTPAPIHATGATQPAATRWRHALHGARVITPMVIGVLPLGLTIGAAIGTSSIPPLAASA